MSASEQQSLIDLNRKLYESSKEGNLDVVLQTISLGADNLDWALYGASEKGNLSIMKFIKTMLEPAEQRQLYEEKANNVEQKPDVQLLNWCLNASSSGGHLDAMKLLRSWGATNYSLAVDFASDNLQLGAVSLLISWGAYVDKLCLMKASEKVKNYILQEIKNKQKLNKKIKL